ncbi:MAG: phytoene/squalene synthase family protein, partial [Archangium sp.]|nr:phytoene/squalene synthase family protein [Archangium sp.]
VQAVHPFLEIEQHALLDTVKRFHIPRQPFLDLIDGMEMDLTKHRYANWAELDLYCYRVAGVVGLMMAPLLGTTDPRALIHAADLGRAMQLTNILRDVKEDLARGRIYLPQDELTAAGVTDEQLRAGVITPSLEKFIRQQIDRARSLYASAAKGVPWLRGFGSMRVVRLMGSIYGGILDVIERRQLDVFSARASVSTGGKLWRLIKILFTPNPKPNPLPQGASQGEGAVI